MACATGQNMQTRVDDVRHTLEIVSNQPVTVNQPAKRVQAEEFPGLELSVITKLGKDTAYMTLFSGISVSDWQRFNNDFNYLEENTKIRKVKLYINSPGGDAFQGLSIADLLERKQKQGWQIEAHGTGIVASAAVPVFAVCSPRYASQGTLFMVHEAALWKWPGRETASDIRTQNELMVKLQDRYIGYLTRGTGQSKEFWQAKEKATTWFLSEIAKEWGLVDHIE
jgi:ATP-dependent protease ClpP protease subunit